MSFESVVKVVVDVLVVVEDNSLYGMYSYVAVGTHSVSIRDAHILLT